ncbi:MAG: hypothetical protein KAX20_06880, partial [Candidatus Omnitrophica bacterium]|nr:hypothetical protein [Candidatus Omnitrophota bacterium]
IAESVIGRKNCIFITYEQLIQNPHKTLSEIEKLSGIQLRVVQEKIMNNELLKISHIITGNRVRKKETVRFNPKVKTYRPNGFSEYIAALSMGIFAKILAYKYCNITTG